MSNDPVAQLMTSHYFRVQTNGMTIFSFTLLAKPEMHLAIPPLTIRKISRELREIADLPAVKQVIETPRSPTRYQTGTHDPAPFAVSVGPDFVLLTAKTPQELELDMPISAQLARDLAQALAAAADQLDRKS